MNVMNVGKPITGGHTLGHIKELTQVKKHTNVKNVGKLTILSQLSMYITKFTLGKIHINGMNVDKPTRCQFSIYIKVVTQKIQERPWKCNECLKQNHYAGRVT